MQLQIFLLSACLTGSAFTKSIPSFLKPCSASDPKLNQCILNTIRQVGPHFADGIPELGLEPLDPVYLRRVDIDNPALKIVFTDAVVTGLKDFNADNFRINLDKGKATFEFTANVTLKTHYKIDGQILILPIKGEGPAKIKLRNLNIIIKYEFSEKDGHWVITNYKDTFKMDNAQFDFKNLFGGNNKQLANTIHMVVNESWETIMKDIAPPAVEQIIEACVNIIRKFFSKVPVNEILAP